MTRVVRPMGDRAVLVECGGEDPAGVAAAIRAAGLPAVVDVVPAAATVLVVVDAPSRLLDVVDPVRQVPPLPVASGGGEVVLPVVYDGPDLGAVAAMAGLEPEEVVARHRGGRYRVAFCGFSPGFAYLAGLDPGLHVPRRPEPRTRVPEGSVAIAGPYTAIYPRSTPGGWHLIGRCPASLWDPTAHPPSLLVPGAEVRFR